jgi:hypothetical protein
VCYHCRAGTGQSSAGTWVQDVASDAGILPWVGTLLTPTAVPGNKKVRTAWRQDIRCKTVDNLPYLCGSVGFSILAFFLRVLACVQQVWTSLGACWRTSALSERVERGEGVDSARPAAARPAATLTALTAASSSCTVSACARATDTLFYLISLPAASCAPAVLGPLVVALDACVATELSPIGALEVSQPAATYIPARLCASSSTPRVFAAPGSRTQHARRLPGP